MNGANFTKYPPFAAGSDTSEAAAESVKDDTATIRAKVYDRILKWTGGMGALGSQGATCDELELACALSHQTCSARVNELSNAGQIVDSGERRLTRSGRKAVVYIAKLEGL